MIQEDHDLNWSDGEENNFNAESDGQLNEVVDVDNADVDADADYPFIETRIDMTQTNFGNDSIKK